MSAKAKSKMKNHESKLADAVAIAGTTEIAPPPVVESPAVELPAVEPLVAEAAVSEAAVSEAAVSEAAAPKATETLTTPTLLLRARIATGKAVVTLFANVRTAQATVVKKSLAWITAADVGIAKSLLAGEQFLLVRLRVKP